MQVDVVSFTRLFPATRVTKPQSESLSIIETFSTHSTAEGLWFYDATPTSSPSLLVERLQKSLVKTLDTFPQYSGHLTMNTTHGEQGGHTERYGRLKLSWGTENDLGVGLVVAKADGKLSDLVPDAGQRRGMKGGWDRSNIPTASLLPGAVFRPALITFLAQITTFDRGGFTIGITTTHALMDGQCLSLFMQHWSHQHNLLFSPHPAHPPAPPPTPIFAPQLLDATAAGDIDGPAPSPSLIAKALTLPHPHHDSSTPPPPAKPPSTSKVFHLPAPLISTIHSQTPSSSRQQSLIAYLWRAVNRARSHARSPHPMNLGLPLDLRRRLALPPTLLGSPIIHADTHLPGRDVCAAPLGALAAQIRDTFARYDAETLRALLHMLAFEEDPGRYAGGGEGMGVERGLVVSVIPRMGFYGAVFEGMVPTFVTPMTVLIEGLVMVMEGRPTGTGGEGKGWTDDGVDVLMTLEAETMGRLEEDEGVWAV